MLRKAQNALSFLTVALATSLAHGQTINIDYDHYLGRMPAGEYPGVGSPGVWNPLDGEPGVPEMLMRVDSTAVPVTITLLDGAGGPAMWFDDPATTFSIESLLDDYAHGGTDVVGRIRFDSLANDTYEVIVYAWTPGSPDILTAVWPDCDMWGEAILVGGSFTGELEEGITHARFNTTVTDGTLEICTAGGLSWEGAINGLQLVGTDCIVDGPELCAFPPEVGDCDGICPMYFHNACNGQCELFYWGCCDGNDNKFETLEECEATCPPDPSACQVASAPQAEAVTPDLGFGTKNRYLSVTAGDPGRQQAIQVVFTDLPSGYEFAEGRAMWLGEPAQTVECAGTDCRGPFWHAHLECPPFYTDWTGLEPLLEPGMHVYDAGIIPGGVYELRVIDETCSTFDPWRYSAPLEVSPSAAGDVVGSAFGTVIAGHWDPPQGVVDFIDISSVVDKFRNLPDAVPMTRADITNSEVSDPIPDQKVDFVDISVCVDAFRGEMFPLPGPPDVDPCE